MLNSYKVGIIFSTYQIIIAKWKFWAGQHQMIGMRDYRKLVLHAHQEGMNHYIHSKLSHHRIDGPKEEK